jgi:acetoin utilization deacetylase AcuC-like enzyme
MSDVAGTGVLIASPRFEEHVTPPGHPERMERAHVFTAVAARWRANGGSIVEPRAATREELERVHDGGYLDRLAATAGRATMLDADTFTSPESMAIAAVAAGAAAQAADHAFEHREPAFALVRPPGHHAEADKAMGFCLYNNVAVAAAAARARGIERVAVVDVDVHHGNGTQWMFYRDPSVLYVSTHQFPFYPGTGAADEIGSGAGAGFTVNVPLEAGATDADYRVVHEQVILPVLDQFAAGLTIVSAGFDAHEHDPLASMRMTAEGYAAVIAGLSAIATKHGAIALVTEGGYDLEALEACLESSLTALQSPVMWPTSASGPARRGEQAIAAARAAQKSLWKF